MNRQLIAAAIALYLFGAVLHLNVLQREPGTIWGDAGDGFFNLWVMNHVTETVARGDWNLGDGRIFWPEHEGTLFWSDNLIVVSPLFALSKTIMPGLLDAYWLTGLVLSILHFAALIFLFYQVFALVRHRHTDLPPHAAWLIPVFAYLAHFSPAVLINHFAHLQNFSSLGLFVLLGGMLAYRRAPSARWLTVMAVSLVITLFFAPYYTVAGGILLVAWAALEVAMHPRALSRHLWDTRLLLAALSVPSLILAVAYVRVRHAPHLPSDVNTFAIDWADLLRPAYGYSHQLLAAALAEYPPQDHEKIAWLGPGLLIGLLGILGFTLRRAPPWGRWIRSARCWFIVLSIVLLNLKIRELRPLLSWYGLCFIALLLALTIRFLAQQYRDRALPWSAGFLALAAALMYGIAFGPHGYYLGERVNPSPWGFFSLWVPGFTSMRAVGRMAFVGQVLLMTLVALWVWTLWVRARGPVRHVLTVGLVAACLLQGLDASIVRARQRPYDESLIRPTAAEREFLHSLEGSLVSIPAEPFAHNTWAMLYYAAFPDLYLMNGYSGRSTARWDEMMRLGLTHGRGAPEQVRYAVTQHVDYVAVRKDFVRASRIAWLIESEEVAPLFENRRLVVYKGVDIMNAL